MTLLEPKEFPMETQRSGVKTFVLSKFPAIPGREIVTKYPLSNIPKIGEYQQSEEVMLKLMSFVAVVTSEGAQIRLTTRALVDNHVGDWETLARLEWAMLEYNCSFFGRGLNSDFFGSISQKAAKWISQMLKDGLAPSSAAGAPPSET